MQYACSILKFNIINSEVEKYTFSFPFVPSKFGEILMASNMLIFKDLVI